MKIKLTLITLFASLCTLGCKCETIDQVRKDETVYQACKNYYIDDEDADIENEKCFYLKEKEEIVLDYIESDYVLEFNEEKTLIHQLSEGYDNNSEYTEVTMDDLVLATKISNNLLEKNGFESVSDSVFDKRVKDVFGRTIDRKTKKRYLAIDITDSNNTEFVLASTYSVLMYSYLSKEYNCILELCPISHLYDYQKLYPEFAIYEKYPIIKYSESWEVPMILTRWKDLINCELRGRSFCINSLIHKNKYLFNDNKESLMWIIENDCFFLLHLLCNFGYDKDHELNLAVLQKVYERSLDSPSRVNRYYKDGLFFTRNSSKKLEIRKGVFECIKNLSLSDPERYMKYKNLFHAYVYFLRKHYPEEYSETELKKMEQLWNMD